MPAAAVIAAGNAELRDEVKRLSDLATKVLGQFVRWGHPGYDARRSEWVQVETLAEWREEAKPRV